MIYVDLWFTMIYPWWFSTRYFTTRNMLHFLANACARLAGTDLAAFISDALGVGHLQAATVCWVAKPNSQWISHMYTVYLYIYIQYRHHLGVSQNGGTPTPSIWSILLNPWTCGSPILRNPVSQHCPALRSPMAFLRRPPQRLTQQSSVLSQEPKGLFGPAGSMKPQMHFQDLQKFITEWVKLS
jgi:hypothetical protein